MVSDSGMSSRFSKSFARRAIRGAEGQSQGVCSDVFRPPCDALLQLRAIVGEESASRFLIARQIAGDREHEVVGGLLGGASLLLRNSASSRVVHQSPKYCGCTAGLVG